MRPSRLTRLIATAALVVAVGLLFVWRDRLDPTMITDGVLALGPRAPVAFILLYALGAVLFAPGALFTLAGGALFGPLWGTLINLGGATLGATAAFLIARHLAADWVRGRAGPRLSRVLEGVEAEGWRFVALVRLVPLFPFNLLNYALGLTRIRLLSYVVTSGLAMLPGALAYTYLGYAGREALEGGEGWIQKGLLALGLLALVAFVPRLLRRLREAPMLRTADLAARLEEADRTRVLDVRDPPDFTGELGHIPAARNIAVAELPRRLAEIEAWRDAPVAIVCHTDRRSRAAAAILRQAGFRRVEVVRGGMVAWNREGRPVAR